MNLFRMADFSNLFISTLSLDVSDQELRPFIEILKQGNVISRRGLAKKMVLGFHLMGHG